MLTWSAAKLLVIANAIVFLFAISNFLFYLIWAFVCMACMILELSNNEPLEGIDLRISFV